MPSKRAERSEALRYNNPGHLTKYSGVRRGLVENQPASDLLAFKRPMDGIRALADRLIALQEVSGVLPLRDLLAQWAERRRADPNFVDDVGKLAGLDLDAQADMTEYKVLRPVMDAIIRHENGRMPYTNAVMVKSLVLAGVEPSRKPLDQSRTMRAGVAGIALSVVISLIESVRNDPAQAQDLVRTVAPAGERFLLESLPHLEQAQWACQVFLFIAVVVMLWARLDDRRKGLR